MKLVFNIPDHNEWYVKFPDDEISLWEYDECGVEIVGNIYDNSKLQIKLCAQGNDIE